MDPARRYTTASTRWKEVLTENNNNNFLECLGAENWNDIYNEQNSNIALDNFINTIIIHKNNCFPFRKIASNPKRRGVKNAWMTNHVKQLKERIILFSDLSQTDPQYEIASIESQKQYCMALSRAKKNYFDNLIMNSDNESKATWDIINEF
ncbi:hypothetical protein JTB14_004982 [Gonioctena quinquepunctata]|nr:hypothetical protein JTB14_004982 [Gonioctena quinquepunctata]